MRVVAVALLLVAVAAGCGSGEDQASPPPGATTTAPPTATGSMRDAAPPLSGESLAGGTLALADFRGRPVLINVWSSW